MEPLLPLLSLALVSVVPEENFIVAFFKGVFSNPIENWMPALLMGGVMVAFFAGIIYLLMLARRRCRAL